MSIVAMLGLPLLACLLLTVILSYLGLHVLKREVIFIDIAVAQIAALGAIAAHMMFHVHGDSPQALACAVGATLLAAAFFAVARHRVSRLPIEATIGITYAIVAAGTLFLIGKSTCGHTHVQEMLAGSLLWVEWKDRSANPHVCSRVTQLRGYLCCDLFGGSSSSSATPVSRSYLTYRIPRAKARRCFVTSYRQGG